MLDNPRSDNQVSTELPQHYTYLYKFRVEQCPLFLQHKCTQHRPYTCFHWHFQNQRRRKPVILKDGQLNYSADEYCTKYDETTGICPDGDDCAFLHRTAGDTERRYHLKYYKTAPCVHETDQRGYCVKNGIHCAFSHGNSDLRSPVYDIRDLKGADGYDSEFPPLNALDKERNLISDDPKWLDTSYVLENYKTEPCRKPPRLCRQGYACPQYHNSRDRRRSPKCFKYRSTPCPSAKHGEEWGDPTGCENGDACQYCHTRTEQQFHPEIYKSTKCHDMQLNSYCPRGAFCAFAHGECEVGKEVHPFDGGTNLADLLSSALPPFSKSQAGKHHSETNDHAVTYDAPAESRESHQAKAALTVETESTSLFLQAGEARSAPGKPLNRLQCLESDETLEASGYVGSRSLGGFGPIMQPITKVKSFSVPGVEPDSSADVNRMISLDRDDWDPFSHANACDLSDSFSRISTIYGKGTVGGLVGHYHGGSTLLPSKIKPNSFDSSSESPFVHSAAAAAADDADEHLKSAIGDVELEQTIHLSAGTLAGSAPVNIPKGGRHQSKQLSPHSPCPIGVSGLQANDGTRTTAAGFGGVDCSSFSFGNQCTNCYNKACHGWACNSSSPTNSRHGTFPHAPSPLRSSPVFNNPHISQEVKRLWEDYGRSQAKLATLEEDLREMKKICEAWRCKAMIAEQQRDEAIAKFTTVQNEMRLLGESMKKT